MRLQTECETFLPWYVVDSACNMTAGVCNRAAEKLCTRADVASTLNLSFMKSLRDDGNGNS